VNKTLGRPSGLLSALLLLVSCTTEKPLEKDPISGSFAEAQAELREVIDSIARDAMTANVTGLQAIHLESDKFTKFGPRRFDRQDVATTNESEAAFFGSVSEMKYEVEGLKIDVFGEVGIVTYYPHVSFVQDGEKKTVRGRQTLVFLETPEGWKIVHEHGTIRR
jgi:ketosteroid isomerase-like protein